MENKKPNPKKGDIIYVESAFHISRGSDDVVGGKATVTKVEERISGGKKCLFVSVKEHPGTMINWSQHLSKEQEELKKEFGDKWAHPDPGIDTPWIEDGDIVNGKPYKGKPIW